LGEMRTENALDFGGLEGKHLGKTPMNFEKKTAR